VVLIREQDQVSADELFGLELDLVKVSGFRLFATMTLSNRDFSGHE